jgi:hypothetical protein
LLCWRPGRADRAEAGGEASGRRLALHHQTRPSPLQPASETEGKPRQQAKQDGLWQQQQQQQQLPSPPMQQQQQPYPSPTAFYAHQPPPPALASSYGTAASGPSPSSSGAWPPPMLGPSSAGPSTGAYHPYSVAGRSAMQHQQQGSSLPPPQLPYAVHQSYGHHPPLGHHHHHQQQQQGSQSLPALGSIKVEPPQPAVGSDQASTPASYDGGLQRADSSPGTPDPSTSTAAHLDSAAAAAAAAAEAADKKEQQKKALRRNMACHQCRRRSVALLAAPAAPPCRASPIAHAVGELQQ